MPDNKPHWQDDDFQEENWEIDEFNRFLREQGLNHEIHDEYIAFVLPDTTLIECNTSFAELIESNSEPATLRGRRMNQLLVNPVEAQEFEDRINRLSLDRPTSIFFENRVVMNEDGNGYRKSYRIVCDHAIFDASSKLGCMFTTMVDMDSSEEINTEVNRLRNKSRAHRAFVLKKRCQLEKEAEQRPQLATFAVHKPKKKRWNFEKVFAEAWVRIAVSLALLAIVGIGAAEGTSVWYEKYKIERVRAEEEEFAAQRATEITRQFEQQIKFWKDAYERAEGM